MTNQVKEIQAEMIKMAKLSQLGEMVPGIAHEINNPMAVIIGRAEILLAQLEEGTVDPAILKKSISKMNEMAGRVSKIVESMRKVSKAAKQSEIGIVNISSLIEDVLNLCTEKIRRSMIDLDHSQVSPHLQVVANYSHLSFALMSLIFNAMEALVFVEEGNRHLWISAVESEEHVSLVVKDSGPGIGHDNLEKIFTPFFTTKAGSSGLGLSLSAQLIQEMGAKLQLTSFDQGACFEIKLTKHS